MSSSWSAADRRPRHSAAETVPVGRVASVLSLVMTTLTGKRHNGAATETVALSPAGAGPFGHCATNNREC